MSELICSFPGCGRERDSRGLCKGHAEHDRMGHKLEPIKKYGFRPGGNPTHGLSHTKAYSIWSGMKNRCLNKNCRSYSNYGGRGITICQEWMAFEGFYRDMGDAPEDDSTLERLNVNVGYELGNCRWISKSLQSRNTRASKMIEYQGETLCLADWSERLNIPYGVLLKRMRRGKSFGEAVKMGWKSPESYRTSAALAACQTIPTESLSPGLVGEMVAVIERLIVADNGCDNPACNIGGGPCGDCLTKVFSAKQSAHDLLSKLKGGA